MSEFFIPYSIYLVLSISLFNVLLTLFLYYDLFSPAAIPEFAYRKVFVTGTFDYDHEILLGPRTREGELGFHIITPLIRGDGLDTILVNRGFVKRIKKNQSERPESLVSKIFSIVYFYFDSCCFYFTYDFTFSFSLSFCLISSIDTRQSRISCNVKRSRSS